VGLAPGYRRPPPPATRTASLASATRSGVHQFRITPSAISSARRTARGPSAATQIGTGAGSSNDAPSRCSRISSTYARRRSSAPLGAPPVPTPRTRRPPDRSWTVAAAIAASREVRAPMGIAPVPSPSDVVSDDSAASVAKVSRVPVSGRNTCR
jgi:hypothetical protein